MHFVVSVINLRQYITCSLVVSQQNMCGVFWVRQLALLLGLACFVNISGGLRNIYLLLGIFKSLGWLPFAGPSGNLKPSLLWEKTHTISCWDGVLCLCFHEILGREANWPGQSSSFNRCCGIPGWGAAPPWRSGEDGYGENPRYFWWGLNINWGLGEEAGRGSMISSVHFMIRSRLLSAGTNLRFCLLALSASVFPPLVISVILLLPVLYPFLLSIVSCLLYQQDCKLVGGELCIPLLSDNEIRSMTV